MPEIPVGLTTTHALAWVDVSDGGPAIRLIDQTRLPGEVVMIDCRDVEMLAEDHAVGAGEAEHRRAPHT